ncbi:MAG: J domain-containing protein [Terriglobales bacterium]|jgi:curved DNA-binding protein CbpA
MNRGTHRRASDPHAVLGVGPGAGDEQIRAAYLRKLKEYPPDRCPAEFESVRDAYDLLRDRRRRSQHTLFACDPEAPLESLLEGTDDERKYTGSEPWLAVMKEKK